MKKLCGFIMCLLCSFVQINVYADNWIQTDWSGGEGQLYWTDTTEVMYYQRSNVDISRNHSNILLSLENWAKIAELPVEDQVYCLVRFSDTTIFAGTGDTEGSFLKSLNDGITWIKLHGHPGFPILRSLLAFDNDTIYMAWHRLSNNMVYLHKSTDGGQSWPTYSTFSSAQYTYSLIESSGFIFAGTGDATATIYKGNVSSSWATTTLNDSRVFSLLKTYGDTLYASTGDNNGIVAKSVDNGDNWIECADLPGAKSVYCLCQGGDSAVYAGTDTSGIIYKTPDGGNTWIECGDLPLATKVRSLICVPDSQSGDCSYLIAGCECEDDTARAFISIDNGENWIPFGAMPGATTPYCLLYTNNGSLLAGTDYNGAIFKTTGYDTLGWLISSVYNTGDTIAPVSYETISWDAVLDGQDVVFRVRSFKDSLEADTLGTDTFWTSCPPCSNGQNLSEISSVHYGDQYVQYRAELSTSNPFITPILEKVQIEYSFGPALVEATVCGDEIWQDSIITNDQVVLAFSEPVDTNLVIDSTNIDSILKLSVNHTWLDSLGIIKSANWDTTGKFLAITLGAYPTDSTVMPGDTVFPDSVSIVDLDSNPCITPCIIGGSFGPVFDSIIAYEGIDSVEYIDDDDYVTFYFSKRTNKPRIDKNNMDSILQVPGHTWLNGFGEIRGDSCIWDSLGFALTCSLKIDSLRPTIAVGDTVYPDSITIWDKFERGVLVSHCVIEGTFGEYGPVMTSAIAYEGWPEEPGLGDGDYVEIFFNKLVDTIPWSSIDIDTVLIAQANGDTHTWHPESFSCYVQQLEQEDAQGIPYTILYISLKVGIEEHDAGFTIQSSRLESYPNPFSKVTYIKYQIPGIRMQDTEHRIQSSGVKTLNSQLSTLNSKQLSVAIGDTIYPNPNVITDLGGHKSTKSVVLQGEFKKSPATTHDSRLTTLNSQLLTLNNSKLSTSRVSLRIYNLAGQLVRTLVNEQKIPGEYKVQWDGLDGQGRKVKSGIYFYKLNVNGHILTRKLTLLK